MGALILREWRTSWADRGAYVLRAGYAGVLLLAAVAAWIVLPMAQSGRGEDLPGLVRSVFGIFCKAQFLLATLLASMTFARAVSREQEQGTMDLLILSSLTRTELLLGKLVGEFLGVAALLASGIPVIFLLLPLGGLTPAQILCMHLLLLAQVLLVGGVSVGLSALFDRALPVMACVWGLIGALIAGPLIREDRLALRDWRWRLWDQLSLYQWLDAQVDGIRPPWGASLGALGTTALIGLLACGLGSLLLEQRLSRGPTVSLWVRLGLRLRIFAESSSGRRLLRPLAALEHPLMIREFAVYRDLPFRISWFLLVSGYAVAAVRVFRDVQSRVENQLALALVGLAVGALIAVLTGALSVGYDRLRGRLTPLLAMGVAPEDIVQSRLAGLLVRMLYLTAVPAFHLTVIALASEWCPPSALVWRIPATMVGLVLAAGFMAELTLQAALSVRRPEVAAVLAVLSALPVGAAVLLLTAGVLPGFAIGAPLVIAGELGNYSRCIRKLTKWVLR